MGRQKSVWPKVLVLRPDVAEDQDERTWDQCGTLVAAQYEVSVIGPPVLRDVRDLHYYARRASSGPTTRWWSWLMTGVLSVRVLYERGFDFIQWNNPPDSAWLIAAPYRLLGKRLVYDQREDHAGSARGSRRRWRQWMERCSYRVAHRVVVAQPPAERGVAGRAAPTPVTFVPSGPVPLVPAAERDMRLAAGSRRLCCAVEPVAGRGGGEVLLHVWALLVHERHRTDLRLALLTPPEQTERLRSVVQQLQLDEHVDLVPRLDLRTLSTYFATAALCLVADVADGMPDAVLSTAVQPAMSVGLPHVVFDRPALRRVIGPTGLYAAAGDVASLAECILHLVDQEPVRRVLGRQAAARASQQQWQAGAAEYVRTYDELLGISGGRLVVLPHETSTPQEPRYVVRRDLRRSERRRTQRRPQGRPRSAERRAAARRADDR